MNRLINSGFCFLADLGDHKTLMENKFTGLRVIWDASSWTYTVLADQ